MNLLAADLRVLANLPASRAGRQQALGLGIGLALLATLSWWFAQALVERPWLLAQLHQDRGGDSQRALLGYGLLACPIVASWLGLAQGQRQLFEAPELALWRQAPIARWRAALQILARATFAATCWSCALAGPFLVAVLRAMSAPAWAYALVPLAIVCATMPLLTSVLATQLALVRFFAGPWLRLVFAIAGALASVGFSAWLLLTMFAPGGQQAAQAVALAPRGDRLPWTIEQGSALLGAAGRGAFASDALLGIAGWLACSIVVFWLAAHLHPRAYERHLAAEPPLWRSRGGRWPASIAAAVRRKEIAQVLQQPGALIGFLLYAVLVFALTRQRVFTGSLLANAHLPREVVNFAALMTQWLLAVLLVLYAHMGRLVLWDSAQWSLWVASPAAPGAILRGKLTAIFAFLMWPLLLVAVSGTVQLDADAATVLVFVLTALGATFIALGVLALVGTWPRLLRPGDGPHAPGGGRGFFAAMLLVLTFYGFTIVPAGFAWELFALERRGLGTANAARWWPAVAAGVWLWGLAIAGLGAWIGTRNYRRLLQPR
jgi:hypothetical protein